MYMGPGLQGLAVKNAATNHVFYSSEIEWESHLPL